MKLVTENLRIRSIRAVSTPAQVQNELPLSEAAARNVVAARRAIQDVLHGRDERLLAVLGPCSIHDPRAALEYAERLLRLREEDSEALLTVMRVYLEKPLSTVGWKGLSDAP